MIKEKWVSKLSSKLGFPTSIEAEDNLDFMKKTFSWFSRFLLIRNFIFILIAAIGLSLPTCSLLEMQENNRILQEQTSWIIRSYNDEMYREDVDRLGDKTTEVYKKQRSLNRVSRIQAVSENPHEYDLGSLDLSGLILKNQPGFVRFDDVILSGSVFNHELYNYSFSNSVFNDVYLGFNKGEEYPYSILKKIEIHSAKIFNSKLYGNRVSDSKLYGVDIRNTEIYGASFCRTSFKVKFINSSIKNTIFYCNDDAESLVYSDLFISLFEFFGYGVRTIFLYTNFDGVELENVNFSYADLSTVINLSKAKAVNVCGNEKTIWPDDISFPNCEDIGWKMSINPINWNQESTVSD